MTDSLYNDKIFKEKRRGKISFRWSEWNKSFEFVRYYKNPYYVDRDKYTRTEFGSYVTNEGVVIDESALKYPEYCCTIAFFRLDDYNEPRVELVGDRVFDLCGEDLLDFRDLGKKVWDDYHDLRESQLREYINNKNQT